MSTYTRSTNTTKTARRGLGALAAAAALALGATLVPAAAASADDFYTDDELQKICNNAPTSQTKGSEGDCTFEVQSEGEQHVEWLRYGEPVSNCNAGTTTGIKSTIGNVRSFSETWKAGGGVGLELWEVLKIEGGGEYSQTRTVTNERRDEITANPGRKAAVTLGTGFVDQTGRIRVDINVYETNNDGSVLVGTEPHYIDNVTRTVPNGYTEKGQDEVGCDEDFRVPA
ncbi:hypothetical protein [Rathayibacter sp. VKM Ac-2927]|uniref:hypothetical protein n=1 Tax=Rathayibacter sp. VKM Ac-2927 TaxID=2929478 RepID=UPI001FB33538|nr:hypothetical protein [Rathayibacter sp. VKM Ac-2927]MCJ1688456.1 hypothetical protein [Rathayibacter sp. VKM Ac-2927]